MKPVLIYDGDCGFCRYWLAQIRRRAGERLEYIPLQSPALRARFRELSTVGLKQSVHLVGADGAVHTGAAAIFEAFAIGGTRLPIRAYRHIPGVAAISELAYRLVAGNRGLFGSLMSLPTDAPESNEKRGTKNE